MAPISNRLWLSLVAVQSAWFRLTPDNAKDMPANGACAQSLLALTGHRVQAIRRGEP